MALVLVLVLGGAGFVVYKVLSDDTTTGQQYAKQWDPRVVPLVHFVEKARGLTFKHPIKVEFLSDAQFRSRLLADPNQNSKAQAQQSQNATSMLRAIGLVAGNVDIGKESRQLTGSSVIGFYSFRTKSLAVRGQALTLAVKDTLVHELTHALQDQYFDIGAAARKIEKDPRASSDAVRTVIEGDAVRIEEKYAKSLSAADQRELDKEQKAEGDTADRATRSVPQILQVLAESPYVLGPKVLDFAVQAHDPGGADYVLKHLPDSDMQVMQPWRYLDGDLKQFVPEPALRSGERRFDHGTFGAESWYYMLAEQLGPTAALRAVDGWAGDSFVAFRRGARACFRATYEATSGAALRTMNQALRAWIHVMPAANKATESLATDQLSFSACDPGAAAAKPVKNRSIAAVRLLVERVDLATAFVREGASVTKAGCAVDRIATRLTVREFETSKVTKRVRDVVQSSIAACR